MSERSGGSAGATRRGFLTQAVGLAAVGSALTTDAPSRAVAKTNDPTSAAVGLQIEPFWGKNQGGIVTPAQGYTYFASLDLTTTKRAEVVQLLQAWTKAAARM